MTNRIVPRSGAARATMLAGFVLGLLMVSTGQCAPPEVPRSSPIGQKDVTPSAVTGFIVKYRVGASLASKSGKPSPAAAIAAAEITPQRRAALDAFGSRLGITFEASTANSLGHRLLKAGKVMTRLEAESIARQLQSEQADIEWVVPDVQVPLASVPNDTYWPIQWTLFNTASGINMPGAWDLYTIRRTSSDPNLPIVAIIDSGYRRHEDMPVPEFGPNTYNGVQPPLDTGDSFLKGECPNDPNASLTFNSWHGLKIQGQIAATTSNSVGMAGVDGQLKILQARYYGKCGGSLSAYINAIIGSTSYRSAAGQRVRVMNLSQGGQGGACYAPLQDAITNAINAGITIVASAGNDALDASISPPGNCAGVIAVAATNINGARANYSNFGGTIALAAPGGEYTGNSSTQLPSTAYALDSGQAPVDDVSTNYQQIQGTSFAAPHVSAVAGMMLNINPALTPAQVRAKLIASAKAFPASCVGCGSGLLDARAALVSVLATIAQTINFPTPSDQGLGAAAPLTATASSGLAVVLTSSTPSTCSTSGLVLSPLALGTCTITATQPGDATYLAASPVTRSFQIKQAQTVTLGGLMDSKLSAGSLTVTASSSSGLSVAITSTTPGVCTVSGLVVHFVALGTCGLTASQSGNSTFAPASTSGSFVISVTGQSSGDSQDAPTLPEWGMMLLATALLLQATRKKHRQAQ